MLAFAAAAGVYLLVMGNWFWMQKSINSRLLGFLVGFAGAAILGMVLCALGPA
jgi:uncharacterized membrane protein